jgi:alpha-tubulin suppressor-like RCC1 family protein
VRRVLTRATAIAVVLLPMLAGCTIVAGLGEPKQGPDGGTSSGGSSGSSSGGSTNGDADIPEDASSPALQPFAIAVGGTHACALLNGPSGQPSGVVRCWGSNLHGELGADPTSVPDSPLALEVPDVTDAQTLALSAGYSCATTSSGNMLCWGAVAAELSTGFHREKETPAFQPSYMDVDTGLLDGVQFASVGPGGGAVLTGQALVCWGSAMYEERDSGSGAGSDAGVTLGLLGMGAVGRAHACAITQDMSDVECWGDNSRGQCAVPPQDEPFVYYPTFVGFSAMGVGTVTGIAAGADFTCA